MKNLLRYLGLLTLGPRLGHCSECGSDVYEEASCECMVREYIYGYRTQCVALTE